MSLLGCWVVKKGIEGLLLNFREMVASLSPEASVSRRWREFSGVLERIERMIYYQFVSERHTKYSSDTRSTDRNTLDSFN